MIRRHQANSEWLERPVGIVVDATFFDLPSERQFELLEPFDWVEFKASLRQAPRPEKLWRSDFRLADVQLEFRIGLTALAGTPSLAAYTCESAREAAWEISPGEAQAFAHERFRAIPGVTAELLDRRYVRWARDLVDRHPDWCLRLRYQGSTQGWFLAEPSGAGVHLTLAMLAATATVSGQHLYHRALLEYARRGAAVGHASFSAANSPVLNIYSQLGARFGAPFGCWLWLGERCRTESGLPDG